MPDAGKFPQHLRRDRQRRLSIIKIPGALIIIPGSLLVRRRLITG
jgi:hypothetical protein